MIPVYLDNVWGSVMSFSGGRFVRKWPRGWRRTVVVAFGPPVEPPVTAFTVRQAVLVAGVDGPGRASRQAARAAGDDRPRPAPLRPPRRSAR